MLVGFQVKILIGLAFISVVLFGFGYLVFGFGVGIFLESLWLAVIVPVLVSPKLQTLLVDTLVILVDKLYKATLLLHLGTLLLKSNQLQQLHQQNHPLEESEKRAAQAISTGKAWKEFCDSLQAAGEVVLRGGGPGVNVTDFDRAEGFRYISRLIRGGLESFMENSDPLWPCLQSLPWMVKLGADNPDNHYLFATLTGNHSYIIYGTRGTIHYLSFGAYAGIHPGSSDDAQAGVLQDAELEVDDQGRLLIWLSTKPPPKSAYRWNWLRLAPNTEKLIIRQSYMRRDIETEAEMQLERIVPFVEEHTQDLPLYMTNQRAAAAWSLSDLRKLLKEAGYQLAVEVTTPLPLTCEQFVSKLAGTSLFLQGAAHQFHTWSTQFATKPNELNELDPNVSKSAWADPNLRIFHGYWKFDVEKEALLIESNSIPQCDFWNFQLDNWWMESLDYRYYQCTANNHTSKLLGGSDHIKIVVAKHPVGRDKNFTWIDTCHRNHGTMAVRLVRLKQPINLQCSIVPLSFFSE